MKRYSIMIIGILIILCLLTPVQAGKVSSSSGGIGSSQQGSGSGYTVKSGSAGHSAMAEVFAYGELVDDGTFTGGEFEYSTFGEEEETDDIVTVNVKATNLEVSGSLDPATAFIPGSTVSATAFVRASGDETGITGVYVDTEVFSRADLNLQSEARGEAYALAKGQATASGILAGVGEVSAESKGITEASAESEGNMVNPVTAFSSGQIYGYSQLSTLPVQLSTTSLVLAEFAITNGAEVEASADGNAQSSAESLALTGKSSANGYAEISAWNEGNGLSTGQTGINSVQTHGWDTDSQLLLAQVFSFSHADTNDDDFGSMAECYALGDAATSGKDLIAPPGGISSISDSVEGGAWSAISQYAEGSADANADLTAISVQSAGASNGLYITGMPGPGAYDQVAEFSFLGMLTDESHISGTVILADGVADTFSSGGASAWGSAGTSAEYFLHQSHTSVKGEAGAGGDAYDNSDYQLFGEVTAFNFILGTTTIDYNGAPAGSFDTRVFSGSSIRTLTVDANGDYIGNGYGYGEAGTSATVNEPGILSTSTTSAKGLAQGSGHLFSAEIVGITAIGLFGDADFVAPVDPFGAFVATDSGMAISQFSPVIAADQTSTGYASGSAKASGDLTTLVDHLSGRSEVSGLEQMDVKLTNSGSFTRALNQGSSRSYYDPGTNDAITSSLAETYGIMEGASIAAGSSSKEKVSLTGMKASATGSFSDLGDFTSTSESALAGTAKLELATRDIADSWVSARMYSLASTTHDLATDFDLGRIDAYYQAYADGMDDANQKALIQLSGVKITDKVVITDEDGSAVDSSEEASLSLAKGSSKIDFNTGSNKVKITFPYVNPKINGEVDAPDEIAQQVQTQTQQSVSSATNTAWTRWRAAVSTNGVLPAPPLPPQP